MEKAPPTWQGAPEHFKRRLVDLLDYKSRCRLRLCSRHDRDIVDTRPVFLEKFSISANKRRNKCGIVVQGDRNQPEAMPSFEMDDAVLKVSHVFLNKNSRIDQMVFTGGSDKALKHKLERLCSKLVAKLNETGRKLKVEKIEWRWHDASAELFLKVLKVCDPAVLKHICIWERLRDMGTMIRIMKTEQWQNAHGVFLFDSWDLPIDHFLHFNQLRLLQLTLPSQEIEKVIKSFIDRGAPLASNFRIYTCEPFDDLCRMVEGFNSLDTNEIYSFGGDPYFVKRLMIPSSENILVVACIRLTTMGIASRTHHVLGMVCRPDHVEVDFKLHYPECQWFTHF